MQDPSQSIALAVHSANRKLGGAAATHVAQGSCPNTCPLLGAGCYAESGPQGIHSRRLARAAAGRALRPVDYARAEASAIDALSPKSNEPLRLGVVGDARTVPAARMRAGAAERWQARGGGPTWTYTHAWRTVPRSAYGPAISPLASIDDPKDARVARTRGYAPALIVGQFPATSWRKAGTVWIACPSQTRGITCAACRLCWRADTLRDVRRGVAFQAHGSGAPRIRARIL